MTAIPSPMRNTKAIIIPACNSASTIAETLRSVQACRGISEIGQVFVCDDGSTDDTVNCARNAWRGPSNFVIERNERNLGQWQNVNAAIERVKAAYEWIFILHADDVVKENWLELYLPRISNADPRVASICSSYDCWFEDLGRI